MNNSGKDRLWNYAIECIGVGVWDLNPQTDEAFYSKEWRSMFGYKQEQVADF